MKKFLVVLLFVAAGCNTSITTNEGDKWHYEESYNMQNNTKAQMKMMVELEDQLMYFADTNDDGKVIVTMLYSDKNGEDLTIENENPENDCTLENLNKCSNAKSGHLSKFHYYDNSLYYVYSDWDEENESIYQTLHRCDLDGKNDEEVYRFKEYDENSQSFFYQMHKGYMYYATDNGGIHKVNLTNFKKEKFVDDAVNMKCYAMYFYGDIVYMCLNDYEDEEGVLHTDAVYKVDLKTNEKEFVMDTEGVYHIDLDNIIYIGEDYSTYIYNIKNDDYKKIIDDLVTWVYRTDDYYLIDGVGMSLEEHGLMYLVNLDGKILDQKEGFTDYPPYSQGVVNDNYFIYDTDKKLFVYYPISDGKFGDLQIVESFHDYKK
ncbi:hypothetical protein [Breznakia pachnodae]|uniref:DUF5050 domain-containing protein n=1 Tax=Breznakia pachnodae TaxID=265178 RepID=A0ABU0E0Z8_9FIRM|nr:hypothetical protein [Breznakia pachnodae]MDQ0360562.1 hypothetical protein [Breznakia pachnodae]